MSDAQFPSGPWTGFYNYAPGDKHRMDLHLVFKDGSVSGDGNDDIGLFLIRGKYDAANMPVICMQRHVAHLPLHGGVAPAWLFQRMVRLAGAMTQVIVEEYGPEDMLRRLADPWWFQAFGCVLGFDWHSSGVTTVTCGALKEAHRRYGDDLGILVAGGKGGTSRKTPTEITGGRSEHRVLAD